MFSSLPLHSWKPALWSVCSLGRHSARAVFEAPWQLHERNNRLTCSMSRSVFLEQRLQYCRASPPPPQQYYVGLVCDLPPQQSILLRTGVRRGEMRSVHRCWQSWRSEWLRLLFKVFSSPRNGCILSVVFGWSWVLICSLCIFSSVVFTLRQSSSCNRWVDGLSLYSVGLCRVLGRDTSTAFPC